MEVVTLRLPEHLVSELDRECEHRAFDSRSAYVRAILQHRNEIAELEPPDDMAVTDRPPAEIDRDVQQLQARVDTLEERLTEFETMTKLVETVEEVEAADAETDDELFVEDLF